MLLEHVSNIYIYIVKTLNRPIKWIGRYFNLRGKVSNKVEQSKIFFDSLRTIIRDQAKMVKDRINLLSGHPSTGYPVVAAIKTVAMLFVIILAVQGVFHSPYYFCGLYGYFVVVSCANITLVKMWVSFEWVLCFIWNLFPEPIKAILCCLSSTTLRGVVTVFSSFLDWASNLRIDRRCFWQLCSLCGIVKMTIRWVKSIFWWTY